MASATVDAGPVRTTTNGREVLCAIFPGNRLMLKFALNDIGVRLVGDATVQVGPVEGDVRLDADSLPHAEEVLVDSVDYALPDGTYATATNVHPVHCSEDWSVISAGWYVVTQSISWKALRTQGVGAVNLILANGTTLGVDGGIRVGGGGIVIYAQPPADVQNVGTGRLSATGKGDDPGIGGGRVTINGGIVTANGDERGAGIGGGTGGIVTINGGTVNACSYCGAGIGGGFEYSGGIMTINGGTVTARSEYGAGIGGGANGDGVQVREVGTVNLGESVEVVEGSIELGSHYVKIAEKTPVGPTCEGRTIARSDAANAWVVAPTGGVTEVSISGLPEGAKLAVKCGGYVVPSAAFVGFGDGKTEGVFSLALDENGVVMIGGEEIPVKPTIGDLDEGEPFAVGEGFAEVTVKAIPGLKYALERTDSLRRGEDTAPYPGWEPVGEPVVATGATVTLKDTEATGSAAFYRVEVSVP